MLLSLDSYNCITPTATTATPTTTTTTTTTLRNGDRMNGEPHHWFASGGPFRRLLKASLWAPLWPFITLTCSDCLLDFFIIIIIRIIGASLSLSV